MYSETRHGPGCHSREITNGESEDTRARCGGSKGKPSTSYPSWILVSFQLFIVLVLFVALVTLAPASTTRPRLDIRWYDQ